MSNVHDSHNNSTNHNHQHAFHCPVCLSASEGDDRFGSPCDCPEAIPTPRYSSPNSGLSPEELKELDACIHEINDLLMTLAVQEDESHTQLRMRLQHLRKRFVRIHVKCGEQEKKFLGGFKDAGKDFIILNNFDEKIIIPIQKICSIDHDLDHDHDNNRGHHEPALLNIDQQLRRDLVLHFGKVVSGNPSLINLFFGISLGLFLVRFIGCDIQVALEEENKEAAREAHENIQTINGCLINAEEDAIQVEYESEILDIKIEEICFIII